MLTLDPFLLNQLAELGGSVESPEEFLIMLEEMLASGEYEPHEIESFLLDITVKVEVRVTVTTTIETVTEIHHVPR